MTTGTIQDTMRVRDNVTVVLTDIVTGKTRTFTGHNTPLNYAFSVFSQWDAGVNNSGQNAVLPATVIALGSGSGTPAVSDTGLFTPITGATASLSFATANSPSVGTTTKVWQIPAGEVTTQVTEAVQQDTKGNAFYHTMFSSAFTPSSTENITITWEDGWSA